jgi:GNAT superfamily N-acetyltransferase
MDPVTIASEPAGSTDARACVDGYFADLAERFPGEFKPARCGVVDDVEMSPPQGRFLVVRAAGRAVGCGGVRTLEDGVGEIKRMWLHTELRGRGLGRRLLHALEQASRDLGHTVVRLDTSNYLTEAINLYTVAGYRAIPPYNDNADADLWFEKRLTGSEPRAADRQGAIG